MLVSFRVYAYTIKYIIYKYKCTDRQLKTKVIRFTIAKHNSFVVLDSHDYDHLLPSMGEDKLNHNQTHKRIRQTAYC